MMTVDQITKQTKLIMANAAPFELANDPRTLELYETAIKEGKERDRNIRVMVIGCYGQGKSSLVRRLTGQSLQGVESTNGIEVQSCNSTSDGSDIWKIENTRNFSDGCLKRLVSVARSTQCMRLLHDNSGKRMKHQKQTKRKKCRLGLIETAGSGIDSDNSDTTEIEEDMETHNVDNTTYNAEAFTDGRTDSDASTGIRPSVYSAEFEKEIRKSEVTTKAVDEHCLRMNIWDFGGQFVYYATHQLFHSRHALYLLVFNIAKALDTKIDDEDCPNKMSERTMEEYLKFWVSSVSTFVGNEQCTDPPIFLVGTHLDMLEENYDEADRFEEVRTLFDGTNCAYHIQAKHFAISNTNPKAATLNDMRRAIIEYDAEQSTDRFIPAKWIPLERSLKENRLLKIISFDKLKEIDNLNEIPVASEEQLKLFLQYHHGKGTFFYFENEDDALNHIVLEPQFLIDAFRCIITAGKFCRVQPNLRKLWRTLCDEAVLKKELLHELWSKDPDKQYMKFEKPLLSFLQRHRIIAEALAFNENDSTSPMPLGFYIVPSLLKKTAEGVMETFLRGKKYTKLSLGYVFEYESVLRTIFNRVIAAVLGKWPVLVFQGNSLIFENAVAYKISLDHAGLLKMSNSAVELLVVNLCPEENVSSDVCDAFRRFVELVIEQELHKFQRTDCGNRGRGYIEKMRCYDESHGYSGSLAMYEMKTLQGYNKIRIGCPDHCSHYINIRKVMDEWFSTNISSVDIPKRKLTEKELSKFSTAVGKDWEYLARQLGFPDAEIEQVCLEKSTPRSQIYEILRRWRNRAPDGGTLNVLVKAVKECRSFLTVNDDTLKNLIDGIL